MGAFRDAEAVARLASSFHAGIRLMYDLAMIAVALGCFAVLYAILYLLEKI
jgi:hypothetical protein